MLDIKEVSPAKFDEIWHIFKDVVKEEDTYPYPADITKDEARSLWFAPGAKVYHAYINEIPIATRYIVPNKPGLASHVCNTGVMIDKAYRGKGYGKILNDFAIKQAKELGYKAIQLNLVVASNEASVAICKQNGFEVIGVLPGAFFYKRERYVDAYVMFRKL
jgi:L-amino acid N-acyltransferase YncA